VFARNTLIVLSDESIHSENEAQSWNETVRAFDVLESVSHKIDTARNLARRAPNPGAIYDMSDRSLRIARGVFSTSTLMRRLGRRGFQQEGAVQDFASCRPLRSSYIAIDSLGPNDTASWDDHIYCVFTGADTSIADGLNNWSRDYCNEILYGCQAFKSAKRYSLSSVEDENTQLDLLTVFKIGKLDLDLAQSYVRAISTRRSDARTYGQSPMKSFERMTSKSAELWLSPMSITFRDEVSSNW
jgi:hypothetical protein